MLFLDIQRDVWTRLNKPNPPDPQTQARIKSFINQRHRTLLTMPGLDQLRWDTSAFISTPGVGGVALAPIVNRIDSVFEQTNNRRLIEKPLTWLRTVNPRLDSGTPTVYVPLGYGAEMARPPFSGELWASSTSAADVSIIRVEGVLNNTYRDAVSATLSGTTLVQLGTSDQWTEIVKVFVSAPAIGLITLYRTTTPGPPPGTALATIQMGQVRPYSFRLALWPVPTAALTYHFDYTRVIEDMVEDTDEPLLPRDFHDLLAIGARQDEYEKTDDQRFKTAVAEWNQRYAALQYFLQGRASTRIIPHGMRGSVGVSNLGGWYPADFYI